MKVFKVGVRAQIEVFQEIEVHALSPAAACSIALERFDPTVRDAANSESQPEVAEIHQLTYPGQDFYKGIQLPIPPGNIS